MSPEHVEARALGRWGGALAIVLVIVGIVTVVLAARRAPGEADAARRSTFGQYLYNQDRCIESELRRRIPLGTTLFVVRTSDAYWNQGLAVLATPWYRLVGSRADADFAGYVVRPVNAECEGVHLVLTRVRG